MDPLATGVTLNDTHPSRGEMLTRDATLRFTRKSRIDHPRNNRMESNRQKREMYSSYILSG